MMHRIVVTPAGRRRYTSLLFAHLASQRADFDEWHIWLNTSDAEDIAYFRELERDHPWVVCKPLTVPLKGCLSIFSFFKECQDVSSVYLRLDDDVVWLEPGFVKSMFDFRLAHPEFFLVYGNIVNNAVISHLQCRFGNIEYAKPVTYACMCPIGWGDADFSETLHKRFIEAVRNGTTNHWKFTSWDLFDYERVSINCISWLGSEFAAFDGNVGKDEEQWLSVDKPKQLKKKNIIYGGALCAHYAFHTQRKKLDQTNILDEYVSLLPKPAPPALAEAEETEATLPLPSASE